MGTVNRTVNTDDDKIMALRLVEKRTVPFTLSLTDGKHRSTAQNRLQHLWMNEISQQRGDMTPEEARAYCKLTVGVPLLRAQNEAFRERYDEILKPLSYEHKIKFMSEPIDLPVTRLMTTKQHTQYLDGIVRHFAEQGIVLTMPDELRREIQSGSTPPDPVPAEDVSTSVSAASDEVTPSLASSDVPLSQADMEWLAVVAKMLWSATVETGDREEATRLLETQKMCVPNGKAMSETARKLARKIYEQLENTAKFGFPKAPKLKVIANYAGISEKELIDG